LNHLVLLDPAREHQCIRNEFLISLHGEGC
jgi:hypothetical protein